MGDAVPLVRNGTRQIRYVLVERASERHGQNLGSQADPEYGKAGGYGITCDSDLEPFTLGIRIPDLGGRFVSIAPRVDVASAGEDESVDARERNGPLVGAEENGNAPGGVQRGAQRVLRALTLGRQSSSGYTDDRTRHQGVSLRSGGRG